MFQGVIKKNSGSRLRGIHKPITCSSVTENVLNVLKKLGLSSDDNGLYSKRAEWCTVATHLGMKERLIKKHGRPKSD